MAAGRHIASALSVDSNATSPTINYPPTIYTHPATPWGYEICSVYHGRVGEGEAMHRERSGPLEAQRKLIRPYQAKANTWPSCSPARSKNLQTLVFYSILLRKVSLLS